MADQLATGVITEEDISEFDEKLPKYPLEICGQKGLRWIVILKAFN